MSRKGSILGRYAVTIAKRIHLFPYRTQKLSSLALMILGGRPPGKVGRCRFYKNQLRTISWFFIYDLNIRRCLFFISCRIFNQGCCYEAMIMAVAWFCFILDKMNVSSASHIYGASCISAELVVMVFISVGIELYLVDMTSYTLSVFSFTCDGCKSVVMVFASVSGAFYSDAAEKLMNVPLAAFISVFYTILLL